METRRWDFLEVGVLRGEQDVLAACGQIEPHQLDRVVVYLLTEMVLCCLTQNLLAHKSSKLS